MNKEPRIDNLQNVIKDPMTSEITNIQSGSGTTAQHSSGSSESPSNAMEVSETELWKCTTDEDAQLANSSSPSLNQKRTRRSKNKVKQRNLLVTSKYFKPVSKKWIPPKSPYNLIQESLFDNPWQLLIASIFLQKTKGLMAVSKIFEFLKKFPTPELVLKAETEEIEVYFKTLGLQNARAQIVKKFSEEYLTKDWKYPRELFGIGKYGDDSYRIFCKGEWRSVIPHDNKLSLYHKFLWQNADILKL